MPTNFDIEDSGSKVVSNGPTGALTKSPKTSSTFCEEAASGDS